MPGSAICRDIHSHESCQSRNCDDQTKSKVGSLDPLLPVGSRGLERRSLSNWSPALSDRPENARRVLLLSRLNDWSQPLAAEAATSPADCEYQDQY
jgi:hypothetical protein